MRWFYRDRFGDVRPYLPQKHPDPLLWLHEWDRDRRTTQFSRSGACPDLDSPPRTFHSAPGKPESFGDMLALVTFGRCAGE